jgi:lysophospholipase L1-like esterase
MMRWKNRILALVAGALLPMAAVVLGPAPAASAATPTCTPGSSSQGNAGQGSAVDPAAAKIKVWLAGDSTMADPRTACPVGWGNQFDPLFTGDVTVVNNAVGGRSVQTWLYESNVTGNKDSSGECVVSPKTYAQRWLSMLDPTNGMKAGDYLFIQFGINDGSTTCPRHVGPARYQELLGVMVKAAKDRGVRPVLLTPVSALRCSGSTAVGSRGFLTETMAAGRAGGVPVIDLHKLSYTLYNTLKFCPHDGNWNSGPVGAFFWDDHTHFDTPGARQIAGVVAKAVRDQKIPLASYLK